MVRKFYWNKFEELADVWVFSDLLDTGFVET